MKPPEPPHWVRLVLLLGQETISGSRRYQSLKEKSKEFCNSQLHFNVPQRTCSPPRRFFPWSIRTHVPFFFSLLRPKAAPLTPVLSPWLPTSHQAEGLRWARAPSTERSSSCRTRGWQLHPPHVKCHSRKENISSCHTGAGVYTG